MTTRQALLVVMLASAGAAAAHAMEYALLVPEGHERHELLAHTGHGYLPSAQPVVAFLALLALAVLGMAAFRNGSFRTSSRRTSVPWRVALPTAQALTFVAVEVGERLAAHASLRDVGLVLLAGLPIQVALGLLAARLVVTFEGVAARLGAMASSLGSVRRPRTAAIWPPLPRALPIAVQVAGPLPARGPPVALVRH